MFLTNNLVFAKIVEEIRKDRPPLSVNAIKAMEAQMIADGFGPWTLTGPQISPEEWAEQELEKLKHS